MRVDPGYVALVSMVDGRTRHYGDFYGLPGTDSATAPLMLVWGNCQAEAVRTLVSSSHDTPYQTVRVPPVHELEPTDLPHVRRLLSRTAVLVSQPVRTGYRSLPIGTEDLHALLPADAQVIRWPVIRYAGLHPFQIIVRHPSAPSAVPDGVPYHDLRTVLAVAKGHRESDPWDVEVTDENLRLAADLSVSELIRREHRDTDIAVSDVLAPAGRHAAHTINHPGNVVLVELARRILDAVGVEGAVREPDRDLLGGVRAPLDARVLRALGLDGSPVPHWVVDGADLDPDDVHRVHMRWYAEHPEFVAAALDRHAERIRVLGLTP
ncbi:WcbI family polysaccharide biosynthesis putative acetyltransferase [Williamsia phyllosphaerae]|uniref:WcbI family polysaccharide biosynthesis putative acetyltransferase n=1 Tax=Williamsia phyllosphaerae TaxID=885042 RepID=UPI00280AAF75|nr:WcbI family polysaccharide biosynthesis putative acetyltransferase [Williamsia phyllosphaerae]